MAHLHTPRDKNESPAATSDFLTPRWLRSPPNPPTSTSSIKCSPSDLTPPLAALRNLTFSAPSMDYIEPAPLKYDTANLADTLRIPDIHSKLEESTPPYSRTNAHNSLARAISSTRMLHQVLGIQPPEPYKRPPEMPIMLEQRFMAGLLEYGLDRDMQMDLQGSRGKTNTSQRAESAGIIVGKAVLENIREEKEGPVKATDEWFGSVGLTIKTPVGHSDLEAVGGPVYASMSEGGTDARFSTRPAIVYDGSGSSDTLLDTDIESWTQNYTSSATEPDATNPHVCGGLGPNAIPQSASSVPPILFPSPRLEQAKCWEFVQKPNGSMAPHSFVPGGFAPAQNVETQKPFTIPFRTELRPTASVPRIAVQSPSPKKPTSKKRGAGSLHNIEPFPTRTRAGDDVAGLPVLAVNQEATWKFKFPGNTYALLTILLPWSIKMQSLSKQLPDPYLFSINAAFPYPVSQPVWHKLVSVAFYDTSVTPHKEIRFIGPGDVAEISYNEVDVFSYHSPDAGPAPDQVATDSKVFAMKRALGMHPYQTTKEPKGSQRGASGQSRWAYILIQDHAAHGSNETPPHVVIAWHMSAVTSTSECLHTIYPDNHAPSRPNKPAPNRGPQRFSSLQNLAARYSASQGLHRSLRSISSSELPEADLSIPIDDGAVTLTRRVWKMEKAGKIPLIEGYRVDVQKWCGWLDAVGAGKGKVIVWEEKE